MKLVDPPRHAKSMERDGETVGKDTSTTACPSGYGSADDEPARRDYYTTNKERALQPHVPSCSGHSIEKLVEEVNDLRRRLDLYQQRQQSPVPAAAEETPDRERTTLLREKQEESPHPPTLPGCMPATPPPAASPNPNIQSLPPLSSYSRDSGYLDVILEERRRYRSHLEQLEQKRAFLMGAYSLSDLAAAPPPVSTMAGTHSISVYKDPPVYAARAIAPILYAHGPPPSFVPMPPSNHITTTTTTTPPPKNYFKSGQDLPTVPPLASASSATLNATGFLHGDTLVRPIPTGQLAYASTPSVYIPTSLSCVGPYPHLQHPFMTALPQPQVGYPPVSPPGRVETPVNCTGERSSHMSSTTKAVSGAVAGMLSLAGQLPTNDGTSSDDGHPPSRSQRRSPRLRKGHVLTPASRGSSTDSDVSVSGMPLIRFKGDKRSMDNVSEDQLLGILPTMKRKLSARFTPGPETVVLGKGNGPKVSPGNLRLKGIVLEQLGEYADGERREKITIVTEIIRQVRKVNTVAGFVKYEDSDESWWEVTEKVARIKVTAMFRDCLHDRYRSSSASKVRRRQLEKQRGATPDDDDGKRGEEGASESGKQQAGESKDIN